ncbi:MULTISPECIES: hypothetical protein [unclassified Bradyrhizobium]|uniref:hypothetical protein n=1 Tax=unclassified Bradyrhizobium TaxID=2631580 RepID=UPI0029161B32|nr:MULTISPECIES: hypothetical protein [unclassified Bradyrhizobium]
MTDEVDALVREFDAAFAAIVSIGERLRALQARAAAGIDVQSGEPIPGDLVRPGVIVKKFKVSRPHLHRLCKIEKNIINGNDGFAYWNGDSFLISLSRAERHFNLHPLRRRETKNPK